MKVSTKSTIDHFNRLVPILAKKYELKESEAEFVLRAQFDFLLQTIQSEQYSHVKFKHLGKFLVNEGRKKRYQAKNGFTDSSGVFQPGTRQTRITEQENTGSIQQEIKDL